MDNENLETILHLADSLFGFNFEYGFFDGLYFISFETAKPIIEDLERKGLLIKVLFEKNDKYTMKHCYRTTSKGKLLLQE